MFYGGGFLVSCLVKMSCTYVLKTEGDTACSSCLCVNIWLGRNHITIKNFITQMHVYCCHSVLTFGTTKYRCFDSFRDKCHVTQHGFAQIFDHLLEYWVLKNLQNLKFKLMLILNTNPGLPYKWGIPLQDQLDQRLHMRISALLHVDMCSGQDWKDCPLWYGK